MKVWIVWIVLETQTTFVAGPLPFDLAECNARIEGKEQYFCMEAETRPKFPGHNAHIEIRPTSYF